jgi:general secretion pathway protein A
MFLEYYGLREQPFGVTPDPRYLYFSGMHREALASLFYGVETGRGFMTLIAPPGMGKTTLLLHLIEQLRKTTRIVFLFQTQCDSREFFRYLLTDLGVDASKQNLAHMHEALNSVLLSNSRMGRRFLLIIDEAQNLKKRVLETVRLLSDFETPSAKLMQIILSGQQQLADRLTHPALMQLRQRISIMSRLQPFTRAEIMTYIHHRLKLAGYSGPGLFDDDAIDQVVAHSGGVPRNINNICFNALTLAYAKGLKQIDSSIVREVLQDLDINALSSRGVAPTMTTQASPSSAGGWEATGEDTNEDFPAVAHSAWVNGVESGPMERQPERNPIPLVCGGSGRPLAAIPPKDPPELAVPESPLIHKTSSAREIATSLGTLQVPSGAAPVQLIPDTETRAEKVRNTKVESPRAVAAAAVGSAIIGGRFALRAVTPEDYAPRPVILARPSATSAEPLFVSIGSQEHIQAVAHDSPDAREVPKTEMPEQSSIPMPSSAEASQVMPGLRAETATVGLAGTTPEAFDSRLESRINQLRAIHEMSRYAKKAQDSEPRKQWKLIAACLTVLFVAGVGGVRFLHYKSAGDGVVDSTLASGRASLRSNPVAHVDLPSKNPSDDTTPSFRAQRQHSAPTKQSIPSVTPDMFGALNAHPVSSRPAAAAQAATVSSSDAGVVSLDENISALLGITSFSNEVARSSPPFNQDDPSSVGSQLMQPELLSKVLPLYPPAARQLRLKGDVIVNFVVQESGNVSDLHVVSGPIMLRQAALDALRSWKYKPSKLDGQAIATKMQVTISFRLP